MDNITPIGAKAPPSLHELLAAIRRDIADMRSELLSLRLAQAKTLKASPKSDTLPEVIAALTAHVEGYFETYNTPLHLHKITRLFGRRFTKAGTSGFALTQEPELLAKLKVLYADCGALMFLPCAAWDNASGPKRELWIASSDKELQELREANRALGEGDKTPEPSEKQSEEEKQLVALLGSTDSPPSAKTPPEGTHSND